MAMELHTQRLYIRPLTLADAPFILEIMNAPAWLANIGDRHLRTLPQAQAYLAQVMLPSYDRNGFGMYWVGEGHAPIGLCGLVRRAYLDAPDIGFALLPAYEGKGLAFEAASAVLQYAQEKLGYSRLYAIVAPGNMRSTKLLERLGFQEDLKGIVNDLGEHLAFFTKDL